MSNELVRKVQELLATDARVSLEPGSMMRFEDEKIRIIADTVGSRKVRVWDVQTGEQVFLGTADTPAQEGEGEWAAYVGELIGSGPKALIKPDDHKNEGGFVTPEPELVAPQAHVDAVTSSSSSGQPKASENQKTPAESSSSSTQTVNPVNSLFTTVVGGKSGNVAPDSSTDQAGASSTG